MEKILVFDYDIKSLSNYDEFELVTSFCKDVIFIITSDVQNVNQCFQHLVLRNINLLKGDVSQSVKLAKIGSKLDGYSILSSNCMAGFFNQYTNRHQSGPCAFWRYDPHEFFNLLHKNREEFMDSFDKKLSFFDVNGHYYASNEIRKISFNHYKKTSNKNVEEIYLNRMQKYYKSKVIIILGLDKLNFTKEEVIVCAKKYSDIIIVTNYKIELANVFSYPNNDDQFYLKCMHFFLYCDTDKLSKLLPLCSNNIIEYDHEQIRLFNLIVKLTNDVNKKREQIKILNKRLK